MLNKNKFFIAILFLVSVISFNGVIRHDVQVEEYLNLARQDQFDCVGYILVDGKLHGSCVLINSRNILTAAHIFYEYDYKPDTLIQGEQTFIFNRKINERLINVSRCLFVFKQDTLYADELTIYPGYKDTAYTNADLAMIHLNNPYNKITLPHINTSFNEAHNEVFGCGYGSFGRGNEIGESDSGAYKIAGTNMIDSIGGELDGITNQKALLIYDFDAPNDTCCNIMGESQPTKLEYCGAGGDSGSGLFRSSNNNWELIGIYTYVKYVFKDPAKMKNYGSEAGYVRISVFNDWIRQNSAQ